MSLIVIANPKGGVGKSTIATNLAGYFASTRQGVLLGDLDEQQSSLNWLKLRPAQFPNITACHDALEKLAKPARKGTHLIVDTPAGFKGEALQQVLKHADKVLVPLQASMFDILATENFLRELDSYRHRCEIGIVGMRINARTKAAEQLQHYVEQLNLPVLAYLRETQNYIQLAAHGASLWDVSPSRVDKDLPQWQDLLNWLEK